MRYLINFSYLGRNFSGSQKQKDLRTVQGEIEKVLTNINNNYVKVTLAGRTDAKVNALGQKAHFDLDKTISCHKLKGALNSYLNDDIYVNDVLIVKESFHARYMVKQKTYEYKINMGIYNPLFKDFIYQYCKKLNIKKMKKAIKYFVGNHDFTLFSSASDKRIDKRRIITHASLKKHKDIITITFKAKGFLKYQVRAMAGALIKLGEENSDPKLIKDMLCGKISKKICYVAPACGLTLTDIKY